MRRIFIRTANFIISLVIALALTVTGAYAAYSLWDNHRIYSAAGDVQADMLKLKPKAAEEEEGISFEEILAINTDVRAWVSLDNTKIDYPVVQGENNLTYLNRDVYGEFALAGSIYIDSRNTPDFSDPYNLLYGHHMEGGRMFGDLDLYKDEAFFRDNTRGELILPDRVHELEIFACLLIPASEDAIFEPGKWKADISGLITYARDNAMHWREPPENPQVLALSTCASEFTDARTIVLAVMK